MRNPNIRVSLQNKSLSYRYSELLRLLLIDLIHELQSFMSFTDLQTKIYEFLYDAKTEYSFIQDYVFNINREAELKLQLKQSKDFSEKLLKDLNDEIMQVESRIYVNKIVVCN